MEDITKLIAKLDVPKELKVNENNKNISIQTGGGIDKKEVHRIGNIKILPDNFME